MITNFKIYEESYLQTFKKTEPRLQDLPYTKVPRRSDGDSYKYDIDDIVYHIELSKIFIVKSINDCSDNQDYYLINPLDTSERGFVQEQELRDAKPEEKEDAEAYLTSKQYNL